MAVGAVDDDLLASLARRLALLEKRLNAAQREEVASLLDVPDAPERFTTLRELSNALLDAIDPDRIYGKLADAGSGRRPSQRSDREQSWKPPASNWSQRAVTPLAASPELRSFLLEREILIDETSVDEVAGAGLRHRRHRPRPPAGGVVPGFHPAK